MLPESIYRVEFKYEYEDDDEIYDIISSILDIECVHEVYSPTRYADAFPYYVVVVNCETCPLTLTELDNDIQAVFKWYRMLNVDKQ